MTANELTKKIIEHIRKNGGQAERINNIARKVNGIYVKSNMERGTADISATIPIKVNDTLFGLSVKIEVKVGKDKQSIFQKAYQQTIEKSGGIYYIARDLKWFYEWYNLNFK
jgi:LysM repeat protein